VVAVFEDDIALQSRGRQQLSESQVTDGDVTPSLETFDEVPVDEVGPQPAAYGDSFVGRNDAQLRHPESCPSKSCGRKCGDRGVEDKFTGVDRSGETSNPCKVCESKESRQGNSDGLRAPALVEGFTQQGDRSIRSRPKRDRP
jgi:hypothetical protein